MGNHLSHILVTSMTKRYIAALEAGEKSTKFLAALREVFGNYTLVNTDMSQMSFHPCMAPIAKILSK